MIVVNTTIKDTNSSRGNSDSFCSRRNLRGGRFDNSSNSSSSIISMGSNNNNITEPNILTVIIINDLH